MKCDSQIKEWARMCDNADRKWLKESEECVDEATKSLKDQHRMERMRARAEREEETNKEKINKGEHIIQTKRRRELEGEYSKDARERVTHTLRKDQANVLSKLKKEFQASSKTKFVFLSGEFGLLFRDYVRVGIDYSSNDYEDERLFTVDQAAKLLGLEQDCVYVSASTSTFSEEARVFFVYYSKKLGEWSMSSIDEIYIRDDDKTKGYGTFERLANKLKKHIYEDCDVSDED